MERANQTLSDMLAASGSRDRWSLRVREIVEKYNRTQHSVTKYPPAVVLYSYICNEIDEVPPPYRDLLAQEVGKYDTWKLMRLVVQSTTKVRSLVFPLTYELE